jgi:hypothetical protein
VTIARDSLYAKPSSSTTLLPSAPCSPGNIPAADSDRFVVREREGETNAIAERFRLLGGVLDERVRRGWAGAETAVPGRGGISAVARARGLARRTVQIGMEEVQGVREPPPSDRIHKTVRDASGRVEKDPTLKEDLEALVEPTTRGDPESPLSWTCKRMRVLAAEFARMGHRVGGHAVGDSAA